MRIAFKTTLASAAVVTLILCVPQSGAWDRWSTNEEDNCASCHGDFRSSDYISPSDGQNWGNLHNLHRSTMLSGDCAACHKGNFFPVLLAESDGGEGLEAISCAGCHGRSEDVGDDSNYSAGLRQHHWNNGVTNCQNCHPDANPANYTPVGEDVLPSYYFTPDPAHPDKPTDPCNPNGEENYAGAADGLDNDGDNDYDIADSDCGSECVPAPDGDVNDDGVTDFDDLLLVLNQWDNDGSEGGDSDCNGTVDFDDLLTVLSGWD